MKDFIFKVKLWGKSLIRNRLFHIGLVIALVFVLAEFFLGDERTRLIAESMRIAVFGVLCAVTFLAAVESFWRGAHRGAEQMAVAIFGMSMAIFLHAIWIPVSRYMPTPDWFNEKSVTTAIIVLVALSGLGYLIPITANRKMSLPMLGSWGAIAACAFLAGLASGIGLAITHSIG